MRFFYATIVSSMVLASLTVIPVHAQVSIPITNAGFEEPALGDNQFTLEGIPGWTHNTQAGVWRPASSLIYFHVPAPEGSQVGFINGERISQSLSHGLQVGDYQLSVLVGQRLDEFIGDIALELWAGGAAFDGSVIGGTLLSSSSLTVAQQTPGQFVPLGTSYSATNLDPLLGQNLAIRILKTGGLQSTFDDVQLQFTATTSVAAPEPGTLALLGLAGLSRLGVSQKRRGIKR